MTGRRKAWMVAATIFTIVNVLGIGWAVAAREMPHAGIHIALSVAGAIWMLLLLPRRSGDPLVAGMQGALPDEARIEQLQQSVDAVALEVERLGEAQRWAAKVQNQGKDKPAG